MNAPRTGRHRLATAAVLLLTAGLLVAAAPTTASAAAPPGDFGSSFETSDPQPATTTVETDAGGRPIQGNLSGSSPNGLPGSLLARVATVTASAENPPGEVAARLADGNVSTKWLAFEPTGWAAYQLTTPATVHPTPGADRHRPGEPDGHHRPAPHSRARHGHRRLGQLPRPDSVG